MTKRRLATVAMLAVAAVLVLCSCGGGGGGGSKRLSKEEFAKRANALCADYFSKTSALGNPQSEAAALKLIVKTRALFVKMVADVKKLQPPADEQATVNRVTKLAGEQVALLDRMISAIRKRDMSNFNKLLKSGNAIDKESNSLLTRLGATSCTK